VGLAWMAIHAPDAAPLLAAAVVVLTWALVADGPVGVRRLVGLRAHRRGLVAIGVAIGVLPIVAGSLNDLVVVGPCLLAAAVLIRGALVRWPLADAEGADHPTLSPAGDGAGQPADRPADGLAESPRTGQTAHTGATAGVMSLARRAGRITGRTGTMARQANEAAPAGARAVGRLLGRRHPGDPR